MLRLLLQCVKCVHVCWDVFSYFVCCCVFALGCVQFKKGAFLSRLDLDIPRLVSRKTLPT